MTRGIEATVDSLRKSSKAPLPWSAAEEQAPIGDTGDHDCPFVIRDAAGEIVMTLWEQYGDDGVGIHEVIANTIVSSVNERQRLTQLIHMPHTDDWLEAVRLEAAHQVERWGSRHDAGKTDPDWFWLVGWLAGKAVHASILGDHKKALHHTISSGAVLLNWWRHLRGIETTMRPGIMPPAEAS